MHDKLNVVLLTVDSLRADHLGCYGYHLPTSPFMDSLAAHAVLGERMFPPAIPTQPSYTTLLTGQYPTTHGIVTMGGQAVLSLEAPSLPEQFLQAGYATCSIDNLWRQRLWFSRGFEFIVDPSTRRNLLLFVDSDELNHRAVPWIHDHKDEPFFLFMHYWDPHSPYIPPQRYRNMFYQGTTPTDPNNHSLDDFWESPIGAIARDTWLRTPQGVITDVDYVSALYDQEVRCIDDGLREVVNALEEAGVADQTLVIIFGDHGESLTEHGIYFSHHGLYDPVLHVPLLVHAPGRVKSGLRLSPFLQHVDIAPTVLEAAGLPIPKMMEGKSFWKLATGAETEGGYDQVITSECTWQANWSLRTYTHKFILSREPDEDGKFPRELYDLEADPLEEHNIADEQPDLAGQFEARLEEWIAERLRIAKRAEDPVREQSPSMTGVLADHMM